ncbi:hypothetical protein I4I73_01990 [Pseudonocardia sp. KRD-184]|uniref:Uncharacterized protein n=1 Tax=Pseudonocardia oceani TaxID=2792013 RepID=A0ABS6U9R9_9PSEU|nr:hypothetical protein [Pseudonocardia oceani]MBW0089915.1 hypothetical protein [Pseudonocardia oceani]MBW0094769.1 hypothetical protein [Pseudonocardia oceani]MBW0109720.1 hypothetical protein [Pseudonocardia oceani]MBW0120277.1 hypothetical protein [Pseudonocardia oceani]MBW0129001.1 hypothetical protein [Pseudonocardia oceani]
MTSELDNGRRSSGDRARSRAYHRDFWPGIVGYVVVLGAVVALGDLDGTSPWRFLWALLPVLPALWIIRAVVRHVRRIDDHQRGLLLRGLAVGFAAAMIASVTLGFLDVAGLVVPMTGWIVYGVGMLAWAVAAAVSAR